MPSLSAPLGPIAAGQGRILMIDSSRRDLERLSHILRPVVAELGARESMGELPADGEYDLISVNYDGLTDPQRQTLIEAFSTSMTRTRLLVTSTGAMRSDFPRLFGTRALTNLVAKNDEVDPQEFIVTVQKILRSDIFGLEKYFVWGIEPVVAKLTRAKQKSEVVSFTEEYVGNLGFNARFATLFCNVADELVTNAIFNAPTDADGKHRFAHLARTVDVTLEPHEEIVVKMCCDGKKVGISVTDPFGSLTEARVLGYLSKCFRKSDDQIDQKAGGAGLGLYYIFDALSHFIINIRPGLRTEMIGLITLTNSYKDFASKAKSFNIFVSE